MASFCPTENLHGGIESKFFQLLKWISSLKEKKNPPSELYFWFVENCT